MLDISPSRRTIIKDRIDALEMESGEMREDIHINDCEIYQLEAELNELDNQESTNQ